MLSLTIDPVVTFRIYQASLPINGIVTFKAQHISYDLINIAIKPFSLTNVNPNQAGQYLLDNAVINYHLHFKAILVPAMI